MATKKTKKSQTQYTLSEIKDKYFPNRDLKSLTNREESVLTREAFLNILKKIARPVNQASEEQK
jgi:hypothetical protein